jgi:NTE family protein
MQNSSPNYFLILTLSRQFIQRFLFLSLLILIGCQNLPVVQTKRTNKQGTAVGAHAPHGDSTPSDDTEDTNPHNPPTEDEEPQPETPITTTPTPPRAVPPAPKIGIIVGPGFMRSFLSVGILQEFHKARVPIHALVGFEWGSLPAALYSLNGQANEVEWQMLKIQESAVLKKSLIRNQIESQSVTELQDFLNQAFSRKSFEQTRIPFECLTFDFKKKQYFWMKKGDLGKAMPYCLASPPFSKPFMNNVGASDLKLAADNLRQKGANYIVFINTLSTNKAYLDDSFSPEAQVLWSLQQYQVLKVAGIVDYVIDASSAPYSGLDFGARREMIRKGQEIGAQAVRKLSSKLGI